MESRCGSGGDGDERGYDYCYAQTKDTYMLDWAHAQHDFVMGTPASLGAVNHGDVAVWHAYGNSPSDACHKYGLLNHT